MSADAKQNNTFIKSSYRPEIDGLRAFAVTTVIINHFNKEILPGGYLGVDMFFVISGFVITSSLYQRPSKNFKDFISGFYERRIKRLVPALSMFVLIMSIVICLFNPSPSFSLKTGLASLFGFSNLFLLKESTDYFAQSTELNVFTHTWSLGVEEQFYILFPFLVWFSGYGRQKKNGIRNLFLIVLILTIASLIGFAYFYLNNPTAGYFLMPTRFWEMAAGCLLFLVFQKRSSVEQFFEKVSPLVVLILIIGVMYLPRSFAAISTITVVVLSSIFISSLKKEKTLFKIFTNSKVVYLGLISYSLYLWHWGVLSISRWTIGIHWWSVPFQVALMLGLAVTSYKWIETPLRKGNWFGSRWKTYIVGGGVLITLSGFIFALGEPFKGKLFAGNQFNKWNIKVFRHMLISHDPILPTIYLIGDSHAGHYGEAFINIVGENEFNFRMHSSGDGLNLQSKSKDEWILAPIRDYKNEFKKGDIIIFSANIPRYNKKREFWTKRYEIFLEKTKNIGMKYFLIYPTPHFDGVLEAVICQEEWYRPEWAISPLCFAQVNKKEWFASNIEEFKFIDQFLLDNPSVTNIDPYPIICPLRYCENKDQNAFVFKDANHLSSYGAMKLRNTINTFLRSK